MLSSIWVATTTGLPRSRHLRMIRFCRPGTSSGGSSTPRSPRATMTASASSMMPSSRSIAAGFSILARIAARPPIRRRASAMSSGRCTNDSATQSKPSSIPKLRSAWSFLVMAEIGRTAFGTFTPLRSDSPPPFTTVVSAKSGPQRSTRSRMRPSSSSRSWPGCRTAKISGCGRLARCWSPCAWSRSSRKWSPRARVIRPSAKRPTRSLGPCRSMIVPIGRPRSCSTSRTTAKRVAWSSWLPWLKLKRNTSAPASASSRMRSLVELAGPSVATILAQRFRRMPVTP